MLSGQSIRAGLSKLYLFCRCEDNESTNASLVNGHAPKFPFHKGKYPKQRTNKRTVVLPPAGHIPLPLTKTLANSSQSYSKSYSNASWEILEALSSEKTSTERPPISNSNLCCRKAIRQRITTLNDSETETTKYFLAFIEGASNLGIFGKKVGGNDINLEFLAPIATFYRLKKLDFCKFNKSLFINDLQLKLRVTCWFFSTCFLFRISFDPCFSAPWFSLDCIFVTKIRQNCDILTL